MSRLLPRLLTATQRQLPIYPPTTSLRTYSSKFTTHPSPPKLPASEQSEFERLQREASVSLAFQPQTPPTTTASQSTAGKASNTTTAAATNQPEEEEERDVNRGMFRGAPPEFRGDTNPKTGEVGGPKNEPLRWGDGGDWSYNGRVTDF